MIAHSLYSWPSFYNPHIKKKLELVGVLQVVRVYLFGGDRGSAAIFTARLSQFNRKRENFSFFFYKLLSFFCIYLPAWFVVSPWPFRVKRRRRRNMNIHPGVLFSYCFFLLLLPFISPASSCGQRDLVVFFFFFFPRLLFQKVHTEKYPKYGDHTFPVDDGP